MGDPPRKGPPIPGLCQQLSLIGGHGGDVLNAASWAEGLSPVHSPRAAVILVMELHRARLVHLGYLKYREPNRWWVPADMRAAFFIQGPLVLQTLSPRGGKGGLCWAMEVPKQVVTHCLWSGPWPVSLFPRSVWARLTSSQLGTYPLHR